MNTVHTPVCVGVMVDEFGFNDVGRCGMLGEDERTSK